MPAKTCVFDAYGTLFDVGAAARELSERPGFEAFKPHWQKVALDWRNKQLQYTWLRAVTGDHTDFWEVTKNGLDWALEASDLSDPNLREELLALYWNLSAYPEAAKVLSDLKSMGCTTAILSNGSPDMLSAAVSSAGLDALLDDTLSVESVGVFKPNATVYNLVGERFGVANSEVLFVSANGWDAGCATAYGFETAWINRMGEPVDRLPGVPAHQLSDLNGIPGLAS